MFYSCKRGVGEACMHHTGWRQFRNLDGFCYSCHFVPTDFENISMGSLVYVLEFTVEITKISSIYVLLVNLDRLWWENFRTV